MCDRCRRATATLPTDATPGPTCRVRPCSRARGEPSEASRRAVAGSPGGSQAGSSAISRSRPAAPTSAASRSRSATGSSSEVASRRAAAVAAASGFAIRGSASRWAFAVSAGPPPRARSPLGGTPEVGTLLPTLITRVPTWVIGRKRAAPRVAIRCYRATRDGSPPPRAFTRAVRRRSDRRARCRGLSDGGPRG